MFLRISLSATAALLTCAVLFFSHAAEAQVVDASPSVQLRVHEQDASPAYAEELRLANHSLAGPRVELVSGLGFMVVGAASTFAGVIFRAIEEGEDSVGTRAALFGGVLSIGVGAGLFGHSIHRIHTIRQARRQVAFRGAQLSMREGGAYAGASFAF
jgi:hypothetical protein